MIALLKGILTNKSPEQLIIDVNGVGYDLAVSQNTYRSLPSAGEEARLFVYTHVAEGVLALYGFSTPEEKLLFKRLISVSGIGPRLGLAILSGYAPQEIIEAILQENLIKLTSISGIGKKTAERLVIELKDKLVELASPTLEGGTMFARSSGRGATYDDALSALLNLGYNRSTAEQALTRIVIRPEIPLEHIIKESLSVLAK